MRIEPYVIETGTGTPVVLLHAFPLNASMWMPQREALGTSYRVITPDQRGFGGTQLGVGRRRQRVLLADDHQRRHRHRGERVSRVGPRSHRSLGPGDGVRR